jgi:hypothetical protein
MTLRADDLAHSDDSELDRLWERLNRPVPDTSIAGDAAEWERLTRPIPDGAIAGDAAEWDSIIFEIAEALEPGTARVPGRHARRGAACAPEGGAAHDAGGSGFTECAS